MAAMSRVSGVSEGMVGGQGGGAAEWGAGTAGEAGREFAIGPQLSLLGGRREAVHGGLDVDHPATLDAVARRNAKPREFELAVGHDLGHHRHDLGGSDVQPDDQVFVLFCHMEGPAVSCLRYFFEVCSAGDMVLTPASRMA